MNYLEQNTSRNYFRTKIDTALHRLLQRHQAEVYKVGAKVTTEICFGNRDCLYRVTWKILYVDVLHRYDANSYNNGIEESWIINGGT